jgi:hypothetical protein
MEKERKHDNFTNFHCPLKNKNEIPTCAKTLLCFYDTSNPATPLLSQAYITHKLELNKMEWNNVPPNKIPTSINQEGHFILLI